MKRILLCISFYVFFQYSFCQIHFPLEKGNIWQYESANLAVPQKWEGKIVADTILSNGIAYSVYSGHGLDAKYLRQNGNKVFAYSEMDSAEYLLFDFDAKQRDTLSIHAKGTKIITCDGTSVGEKTFYWFGELSLNILPVIIYYHWTLVDNMGIIWVNMKQNESWNLTGANINGNVFGILTEIPNFHQTFVPVNVVLEQNYPNPFNPSTTITFSIPERSTVRLSIFNTLGQKISEIVSEVKDAGSYEQMFNASQFSSGIYFYRFEATSEQNPGKTFVSTKKMILMK